MVQKTAVVVALGLAAAAAAAMPPQRPFQGRSFSMDREGGGFEKEEVDEATGLITTSFRSPPLRLDDGQVRAARPRGGRAARLTRAVARAQVIFTDPQSTPMRMPTGDFKYAITSFGAEVVDSQNRSTPLSECVAASIALRPRLSSPTPPTRAGCTTTTGALAPAPACCVPGR